MKNLKLLFVLTFFAAFMSCSKGKEPVPEVIVPEVKVDPKGKFVITSDTKTTEGLYIFDIRNSKSPKKLVYQFSNGKFKLTNTLALGAGGFASDAKWPTTWTNIKVLGEKGIHIQNLDNPDQLYSYEASSVVSFESIFGAFPAAWRSQTKLGGGVFYKEAYGRPEQTLTGFYFDFATSEYLYIYNPFLPTPAGYYNFKIADLLKKTNGNVDADPIDWTKSELVFCFDNTYNGKAVTQFVFVDLDANTYASFVRNKNDDPVKGADAERQILITMQWEPISQLFENWPIK